MLKIKTKRILAMAVASLLVTTMMGCRHDWEVVESVDTQDGIGDMALALDAGSPKKFFRVSVEQLEE